MYCLVRIWVTLLLSSLYAGGHAFCQSSIQSDVGTGVVVEGALKTFEADKASLPEVDVILHWSRGDIGGEVRSPLDFPLSSYQRGTELAKAGKFIEAGEVWTGAGLRSQQTSSLLSAACLYFHTAETLTPAQQWNDADRAYGEALESVGTEPGINVQLLESRADACKQHGEWDQAKEYYERTLLEGRKRKAENLTAAAIFSGLSRLVLEQGKPADAECYGRQGMPIREKLSPSSLALADSWNDLAHVAEVSGDLSRRGFLRRPLCVKRKFKC
jgi:tetratricopeptide (TPR) repeat protein